LQLAIENNFSGYVLAGGKSSRMGADKAFLQIEGETFLARSVNLLSEFGKTKIVLNRFQTTFTVETAFILDEFDGRGALGGIHAALKDCKTEFALILAVDLPFVTAEAIKNLTNIAIRSKNLNAVVPIQKNGKAQPLCAVYRAKTCLISLEKLLFENDRASVMDFLAMISPKLIKADTLSENDNWLFNVNFPSDFEIIKNEIIN